MKEQTRFSRCLFWAAWILSILFTLYARRQTRFWSVTPVMLVSMGTVFLALQKTD